MVLLLAVACRPEENTFVADELALHDVVEWSDPSAGVDQHHATVAVLAGGRAAVGWTDGVLWSPEEGAWVRALGPRGRVDGPPIPLDAASGAGKPDVVALPDGRALVGYQTDDGVFVVRVDLDAGTREEALLADAELATGNPSVDLALRADGAALAVWYDQDPPVGTYRAQAIDDALAPIAGLPDVVAETEDVNASTADIDVDPDGRAILAWVDQSSVDEGIHCALSADAYDADGALRWRVELASGVEPDAPRRPTSVAFPDGALAIGWRVRAEDPPVPVHGVLAFLDAGGSFLREPFLPLDGDTDDLVIARVGDDALFVAWTTIEDADRGVGTVEGGLMSFPDGEWIVRPVVLSSSSAASRPHADAAAISDRAWRLAVSWEQLDDAGVRHVFGRTATVR